MTTPRKPSKPGAAGGAQRRAYLSVFFRCCNVYQRLYRHADGDRYAGRCPGCLSPISVPIGSGGTDRRVFEAE